MGSKKSEVDGKGAASSLKSLSIRGVGWSIAGHGIGETIRLASNLVLTRLLIPEDFGLMLMVNVFLMGLQLFSDVGIGPSIIQNPRGNDQRFLNTAWTVQVIRGGLLWLVSALLAYPFSLIYDMPKLDELIPVAAVAALISGFNSTKLFTLNRRLHLGRVILLEIGQSLASVTVMIVWAYVSPSVWALVMGGICGALFRAILSHFLTAGPLNKFAWETDSLKQLVKFGKWIFLSTAIGFFADRGDRLILGKVMTEAELGMLSIALVLSQNLVKLVSDIGSRVLFPLYTHLVRDDPAHLRRKISRARGALMAMAIVPLCLLVVWGDAIVELLWDPRYKEAGWMLQVLSVGGIVSIMSGTLMPVLLAMGDSFRHLVGTAARGVALVVAMGVGIAVGGSTGGLVGVAIAPVFSYVILVLLTRRYNVLAPRIDLMAVAGSVLLIGLGFAIS